MDNSILNRIKNEVWLTQEEYMLWNVDPREWEVVETDDIKARVKIRRIDQDDRNGTST